VNLFIFIFEKALELVIRSGTIGEKIGEEGLVIQNQVKYIY